MNGIAAIGIIIILFIQVVKAQELPAGTEQQMENLADKEESFMEDDSYWQTLHQYLKYPLNLNKADEQEIRDLTVLTEIQVENFLSYRRLLGELISVYELQSIPGWDLSTIKKLLPFIRVSKEPSLIEHWRQRIKNGEHSFLIRVSQVHEGAKRYEGTDSADRYEGSLQRIFFRYRYTYKNLLQFGLLGDKDAGEPFLKGKQLAGFDFYSFHFFARNTGIIKSLAIGDFTVNMGQGLIQWQSMAFKKSTEALAIKRQSPVIRPYNSAGEFIFHRGAAITLASRKIEASCFFSLRKLTTHTEFDSTGIGLFFTSFNSSGYHRTQKENANRKNLDQFSAGASITYRTKNGHLAFNGIGYRFSIPLKKKEEPYNLFAIRGNSWFNCSADYGLTLRNFHFFGEIAADKHLSVAILNGLLISLDPRIDLALLYRNINPKFQSLYSNAFTENTMPANEQGWYIGISIRPAPRWKFNVFADIFYFPWLKYQADAPSAGSDYCIQLSFQPDRRSELYFRWRWEEKELNHPSVRAETDKLVKLNKQNWRIQVNQQLNQQLLLRNRVEITWFGRNSSFASQGFLAYSEIIYKTMEFPLSLNLRTSWFETSDYNARVYAYENDVLFDNSIPAFFGRGFRYYVILQYKAGKKFRAWLRWSQSLSPRNAGIEPGLGETMGRRQSEFKIQLQYIL
ncbi:MAG TPA: helix-hairpin-helix domain-containing protein [Chitinophagaceae bacterium]|nr:helix-hairpin-helix domain-containing protein [Chitinophagaceae bacterium]